jgi:alpha/beta hydrolase fold
VSRDPIEIEPFPLPVGKGRIELQLQRVGTARDTAKKAVLIVHGANSGSATFLVPDGGLAAWLARKDWDVWLLDWRGSPFVMNVRKPEPNVKDEIALFTLDQAATDVPRALEFVRREIAGTPLSLLGHCIGGGITSIAIAEGWVEPFDVKSVVLSSLGLFYEAPWDGWVKAEDFILERVLANDPSSVFVDPYAETKWPPDIDKAHARWPRAWLPQKPDLLKRLSFMVGQPWFPKALDRRIDDKALRRVFGRLHLGLYLHCGQSIRRGYAAPFDLTDIIDRSRLTSRRPDPAINGYLKPQYFNNKKVTLIGGAENRLWHRDSLDLMYEWLLGEAPGGKFAKLVFPGYGLQEVYWADDAARTAYPEIAKALA